MKGCVTVKFIKGVCAFFTMGISLAGLTACIKDSQLEEKNYANVILSIIFLILSVWLIYRIFKPKVSSKSNSISEGIKNSVPIFTDESKEHNPKEYVLETPPEILYDMKSFYNVKEIPNRIRILDDCWFLVNNSNNFETVFSRLEFAKQTAYTLKQLEQCGLYKNQPTSDFYIDRFVGNTDSLLKNAIERSYNNMISRAWAELKTLNAQEKRRTKYFDMLSKYEEFFSPDLEEFIEKLKSQ